MINRRCVLLYTDYAKNQVLDEYLFTIICSA